ncbi:MAG: dual specificity protein phosphatase family protein, partial [Blastocatellia bacterium]|nr:dual specificity protein phosphatase family protein [Blastocatellia bacterium]
LVSNHPTVYVHCTAGLNRSPTVTIAYLYLYRGFSLENAISKMRDSRYCEPYPELID